MASGIVALLRGRQACGGKGLITATRCHVDTFARRHAAAAGEVESKRQQKKKKQNNKQQHHFSLKIARVGLSCRMSFNCRTNQELEIQTRLTSFFFLNFSVCFYFASSAVEGNTTGVPRQGTVCCHPGGIPMAWRKRCGAPLI